MKPVLCRWVFLLPFAERYFHVNVFIESPFAAVPAPSLFRYVSLHELDSSDLWDFFRHSLP